MNSRSVLKTKHHIAACINDNRLTEAGKACAKLCKACPGDPESWSLLGAVEQCRSNTSQAVVAYRKAIKLRPNYYEAAYNLGCILMSAGNLEEAEHTFLQADSIRPDVPEVINNLGIVFRRRGDVERAAGCFRRATRINPEYPMAWFNLGNALLSQENPEEAVVCYRRVIALNPGFADAFLNMGNACRQLFLREEAVRCYQQALQIEPGNDVARFVLADVSILLGRFDEAVNQFNTILESNPDDLDALAGKAEALEKKGDRCAAFELIQSVSGQRPVFPRLALTYANLCHQYDACDDAIEWLEQLIESNDIHPEDTASLHQARAKILDKRKCFREAFEHFRQANQLKKELGEKSGHLDDINASLSFFSPGILERLPHSGNRSELPVFIVGMPRSGTSLVEQIIASHPEAWGAGELPYIHRFVSSLPTLAGVSASYPECLNNVNRGLLDSMAKEYLGHLENLCPDAKRVTDKLPHNFMWLGMIELMFPRARVIHCIREPMDNCLSLYTTRGFNAHHSYVFDLEKLGEHYRKYQEIMSMWKKSLNLPVLDLQYESLVSDFETQAKRLIEFCGLEWDEQCLRYHESNRLSATLSYDQVRRPIYSSSVGRWRNYEEFLQPLKAVLDRKDSE